MTWKQCFVFLLGSVEVFVDIFCWVQKFPPALVNIPDFFPTFLGKKFDEVHNNDVETDNKIEMPKTVLFEAPGVSQSPILVEIARIFVIADV